MAVAEMFLTAFITVLFERLASVDLLKMARYEGVYSQLKKSSSILSQLRAVLADAALKQTTDRAVQLWLIELQDIMYELDDIVDELATEVTRRKLIAESQASSSSSTVLSLIPTSYSPSSLVFNYGMKSKLEDIIERLKDLAEQKYDLGLNENVLSLSNRNVLRLPTTSLVNESHIRGRDKDKEAVIELLLQSAICDGNVGIVAIVGMGGIGKTTLAQLVYNDEKVKDHFDLMAWVCVSEELDVFMITKILIESVTQENCEFKDLNRLQVALKEKLSTRKFLIVLDDVWNENYEKWELLHRPFQVGLPGSRIIVTTRIDSICLTMDSVWAYHLKVLEADASLSLFAQHACGANNFDVLPSLKLVGEGIVRKCKGLPLALKTLGRLLRTKVSIKEWTDLMDSEIWDFPEDKSGIIPALRLSYHHLPPHLKPLFAYCSLFPMDYLFHRDQLVLLWMAEGFLQTADAKKQPEDLGNKYFEELLSRSIFQHSSHKESRYVMHDLMNDLAKSVAGEFFFRSGDGVKNNDEYNISELCRHASFLRHKYGIYKNFQAFHKAPRLRTFLPLPVHKSKEDPQDFYLSNRVLVDLLPQLKFLRVLSLSGYIIYEVPDSISAMKHLRYLNLSQTRIKLLPEWVTNLCNLQTLILCGCSMLTKLPSSFVNLINLRHFDIAETPKLQEIPLGIGTLTSLQILSKFIIGEKNGSQVKELKGILDLQGALHIMGLHNVLNVHDAKEANLWSKKSLDNLTLEWSCNFHVSRNGTLEKEVLNVLIPYTKLLRLKIEFYGGMEFPSWVGGPSFKSVVHLTLSGCKKCVALPSLGHLSSLKELFISGMDEVKSVGSEFYGNSNSSQVVAFASLEILQFENMENWEEWSTGLHNVNSVFPCLLELCVNGCPKLVNVSQRVFPSLRLLNVRGCSGVLFSTIVRLASIITLKIGNLAGLTQLHEGDIMFLDRVESIEIEECEELKCLWQTEGAAFRSLVNLKELSVRGCQSLVSLGMQEQRLPQNLEQLELHDCDSLEKLPYLPKSLTSLRGLTIRNCPNIQSSQNTTDDIIEEDRRMMQISSSDSNTKIDENFPQLETLDIIGCSSLTSFPVGQKLPSTLKSLLILNCDRLEESEDSKKIWLLSSMASLEFVYIGGWANLSSFPEGCFFNFGHLTYLSICNCPCIDSFPERGLASSLVSLHITDCKNLHSFPGHRLQSITSLQSLTLYSCPCLESFPNGVWPPNLTDLIIGELRRHISEWGLQNLPASLVFLQLKGKIPEVVSFSEKDVRSDVPLLPPSLNTLEIYALENLESLSMGLQNLTSLEELSIEDCPKLRSLPEMLLPTLAGLEIQWCPLLQKRCLKEKRDYWPLISHIPYVMIDYALLREGEGLTGNEIPVEDSGVFLQEREAILKYGDWLGNKFGNSEPMEFVEEFIDQAIDRRHRSVRRNRALRNERQ